MTTKPAAPHHETNVAIPALDKPNDLSGKPMTATLHCSTAKSSSGGIYSQCNVQFNCDGFTTFAIGGDYRRVTERDPNTRATQKALATQHARNFTPELIAAYASEAIGYYASKAEKRAQTG